jgi:hypothetical protein
MRRQFGSHESRASAEYPDIKPGLRKRPGLSAAAIDVRVTGACGYQVAFPVFGHVRSRWIGFADDSVGHRKQQPT